MDDELRKLAEDVIEKAEWATSTPWKFYDASGIKPVVFTRLANENGVTVIRAAEYGIDCKTNIEDAAYIIAAANAAPQLARKALEMEGEIKRLDLALDEIISKCEGSRDAFEEDLHEWIDSIQSIAKSATRGKG